MKKLNQHVLILLFISLFVHFCPIKADTSKLYNISGYGAIGDGKTMNTPAIQATINACATAGGGIILIPKGVFVTGAIFLKQGVNLRIEKGGVLKGSAKQDDYPQIMTRWEGIERKWTSALLNIIDVNNIEISGEGTIDGSGTEWPRIIRQNNQKFQELSQATRDSLMEITRLGRPRLICFQNCKYVNISNLKLRNQAVWCLHILYCKNVVVKNLNIQAEHTILSSDGIDIDSSSDVFISGCDVDVNDDCISIKSGKDENGLLINRPSKNILIEKCHFGYGHGGVAMGSETSGGIRNVEIRNCVVDSGNWAPIRFKTQPSRSGVVENITYRNIVIKNVRQAFEFNMEWRMVPPIASPAKVLPIVRNVRFIKITGNAYSLGNIHGLCGSPITNVKFINCNISAQKGLFVDNVKDVDFSGLKAEVKEGQAINMNKK